MRHNMRLIKYLTAALLVVSTSAVVEASSANESQYWQSAESTEQEAYIEEQTPPGIQVVVSELDGPVYADERGLTLYKWPLAALRNGSTGDRKDAASNCTDEVLRHSAGLMSPYPPG